jgi:hypothetical protein
MIDVSVDAEQLGQFVDALFRYAPEQTWISLRAFRDDIDDAPPVTIRGIQVNGDLSRITEAAITEAKYSAEYKHPAVFCPPIATFSNSEKASEAALACGLALSVELDANAEQSRKRLEFLLGPATVVVASGGTWTTPETGQLEPKLHVHWRLRAPTTTPDDHRFLKRARALATSLVGGDASNNPTVHPIRWPGGVHRKGEPKLCRIVAYSPDSEIDLGEALAILGELVPPGGAKPNGEAAGDGGEFGEGEDRDTAELTRALMAGEDYHSTLLALSMRYLAQGVAPKTVIATLRGMMFAVPEAVRDGGQPGRWRARYDDIPRTVRQGAEKLRPDPKAAGKSASWSDPEPLIAEHEKPAPYPIEALPRIIRDAVLSYQAFGQQPIELVACSALAATSLAVQGLVDVDRDGNLVGPCSLSFAIIGTSGERKSAADKRMRQALAFWEREKLREQAQDIKTARRQHAIWQAQIDSLTGRIKRIGYSTKPDHEVEVEQLKSRLILVEGEEPKVPPEVNLFHERRRLKSSP